MARTPIPHPLPEFPVEVEVQEDGAILVRAHPSHVMMRSENSDHDVRGGWVTKSRHWIEITPPYWVHPQILFKFPVVVPPKPKLTWTQKVGLAKP